VLTSTPGSILSGNGVSDVYTYTDVKGNTQTVKVNYTQYYQKTNFGCGQGTDVNLGLAYFATSVVLADGETYDLSYEGTPGSPSGYVTGRLAKITLPNGGYIAYGYSGGNNGIFCGYGVVPTLTRTINDNNGHSGVWTYASSLTSQNGNTFNMVTQTDPAGDVTTYKFVNGHQTEKIVSDVNLGVLSTTVTCYNGNNSSQSACISPSNTTYLELGTVIFQTDVYTTLGTSSSPSLVETTYDDETSQYGSLGDVLSVKNYDFGATYPPSGTPLSETVTTYANVGGVTCGPLSTYIFDHPCSITTTNSASNTVSQTTYIYNAGGHPTETTTWVSSSKNLNSYATYNPNGTIATSTDVNGAVTKYYYNGTGGCNNLLLTSTVFPVNSLSTSQEWNCTGAVLTSTTDQNGAVTAYGYANQSGTADPLWRQLSVTDPLNNTTWNTYSPGGTTPATLETALLFNSNNSTVDTLTTFDGLGRPYLKQTRQKPSATNFDTVVTTYDALGRISSLGLPCVSTASLFCSGSATTTTHDALNRPLVVSDTYGGATSYTYSQNDVLQAIGPAPSGENTKKRQMEYNGLGWLTSVCEVTAGTTSYPGKSCSPQVTPQTGYLTKYSYTGLGQLQTVSQSANGSYAQGRSYAYDGLGRLTQEQNPESGTVTYTYDSDTTGTCPGPYTNGDLVKQVDSAGNVICDQYDGLHRITATTYPAGQYSSVTPPKTFLYDTTSETCSDPTGSNVAGRLAEAYTGTSSAKKVDSLYCYSPRGQTTDVYQSTPHSGGYAHLILTYWAHGPITTINGIPALSNLRYGLDGEGRINNFNPTAITPDPVKTVTYNVASQIANVTFNSGETNVYSYDSMNRMNGYTYTLGTSSLVGTPTWNPDGMLGTLNINDQFNPANTQNCTYTYDDLARIGKVGCTGSLAWGQTFTYDQFGNITKTGSSSWIPGYYNSNGSTSNQYVGNGSSYDANGNLTNDTFNTYSWDANGNIVTTVNGATANTYDAFGQLVETSVGPTQFLYLPGGTQPFATMSNYKSYLKVFAPAPGGTMIITPNGKEGAVAYHRHTDWIGSSRFATTPSETVYFDGAYAPFGEPYATSGTNDFVFAGNAQDASVVEGATAGYDYDTPNRKYSASQSRWIRPDPAGLGAVDPSNPQFWNRYVYVLNNPLSYTDPDGLWCYYGATGDDGNPDPFDDDMRDSGNYDFGSNQGECEGHGGKWYNDPVDSITVTAGLPDDVALLPANNGVRAPNQTYGQCLAANSANFSINYLLPPSKQNGKTDFWLGNDVAESLFGNASNGTAGLAIDAGAHATSLGAGKTLTFGRRTASFFTLNLEGKTGPATKILGKTGAKGILGWLSGAFELKFAADIGFTLAEGVDCVGKHPPSQIFIGQSY